MNNIKSFDLVELVGDGASIIKLVNSILLFCFLVLLIVGSVNPVTSLMLLATFILLPKIKYRSLTSVDMVWFLALVFYGVYHSVHAYLIEMGFHSGVEKYMKFIAGGFYYLMIRQYGIYKYTLFLGVSIGGFLSSLESLYNLVYLDHSGRLGLGHNPIAFGTIMCIYSAVMMYYSQVFVGYKRYIVLAFAIIFVSVSFYSGTRNLYIVYIGLIVYFIYLYSGSFSSGSRKLIFTAHFILFMMLVIFAFFNSDTVEKRIEITKAEVLMIKHGDLSSSFGQRLQMWDSGLYLFIKSPIFGYGENRVVLNDALSEYVEDKGYMENIMLRYSHFHNSFIDQAAKFGVIGVLLLLFVFFAAVSGLSRQNKASLVFVMLGIYLIGSITNVPFSQNRTMITFIILISVGRYYALHPSKS